MRRPFTTLLAALALGFPVSAPMASVSATGGAVGALTPDPNSAVAATGAPKPVRPFTTLAKAWLNGAPVLLTNGVWVGETSGGGRNAGCSYCGTIAVQAMSPTGRTVWTVRLPANQTATPLAAVGSSLYVLYWPAKPNLYVPKPPYLMALTEEGKAHRLPVPVPKALSRENAQYAATAFPSMHNLFVVISWTPVHGQPGYELIDYSRTGAVLWVHQHALLQAVGAEARVGILLTGNTLQGATLATGKVLWSLLLSDDPGDIQLEVDGSHSVITYRAPYNSSALTYTVHAADGAGWSHVVADDGGLFNFAPVVQGGSVFGCSSPVVDNSHEPVTCSGYSLANGKVTTTIRLPDSSDDVATIMAASAKYVLLAVAEGPWLYCTAPGRWPCGPSKFAVEAVDRTNGRVIATAPGPTPFDYTYNLPNGASVTLTGPASEWVW